MELKIKEIYQKISNLQTKEICNSKDKNILE